MLAQQQGYVLLGGDFNARVGVLDDVLPPARSFLEASGLPCQRAAVNGSFDLYGELLVDFCLGSGLLLGTGRLPGDVPAVATHDKGGRLDHLVMDQLMLTRALSCRIVANRHDSDHKPLLLSCKGASAMSASGLACSGGPAGEPIPKLQWDGSKQKEYAQKVQDSQPALDACAGLVQAGQVEAAFEKLGDILTASAIQVGCKHSARSRPRKQAVADKPYFDEECRRMRAKFRYAVRHDPDSVRVLANRFKSIIRRKCRQYRQRQTPMLLRQLRSNHKCFWAKFNAQQSRLPDALSTQAAWQQFHQKLCAPPASRLLPAATTAAGSGDGSLDEAISLEEVERALPKLSNGKAAGHAGWPAELLRYAAYYQENGKKVWVLAPLLQQLLNQFFSSGRVPGCVSSALVTPIHKKGSTLDTANYRPIAVGEPLYRLYTIILNKRMVDWAERQGLRSPSQAGFRPRKSTLHHLFALRHFIDRACISKRPLFACFVDLQKAYDTVQHDLLWARLQAIGVSPRMLAAIKSLYSGGTLAMKVNGTAGSPAVQQMGVRQGCPLSPTLFGIFFDGLHDHLQQHAPTAGLQLQSGRWVTSLVYADDVVLLSWSAQGLQQLISSMHQFCAGMGLTISPTKTEVMVFHGPAAGSWHVNGQTLPVSSSFKYLGLIFHESGSWTAAFKRLLQNGNGARARLAAKYKALDCDKSFPMMRRLFDAVVRPTVSYGCEIWGPLCAGGMAPELKSMADVQLRFFQGTFHLRKSVAAQAIFAEIAENPWVGAWWSQVLRLLQQLADLPHDSLHADVLRENVHDALADPLCGNWAAGIHKQYIALGMRSPFSAAGVQGIEAPLFRQRLGAEYKSVWANLHVSPRTAPKKGVKLCTYLRWFARPGGMPAEPYFELPISLSKLRRLVRFRLGSHCLPVEQGRLDKVPRFLRRCTLCTRHAPGDERHYMLECSHFDDIRAQFPHLFAGARGSMQQLMWHSDQKSVADLIVAILDWAET